MSSYNMNKNMSFWGFGLIFNAVLIIAVIGIAIVLSDSASSKHLEDLTGERVVEAIKIFLDCALIVTSISLCFSMVKKKTKVLFISLWLYVALVVAAVIDTVALTVLVGLERYKLGKIVLAVTSIVNVVIFLFFGPVLGSSYTILAQEKVPETQSEIRLLDSGNVI
jgi:cbb3-type cytochrome oxidase subunit 1